MDDFLRWKLQSYIIWRMVSSNLVPLLKPNCFKKNNSSREEESRLCFHWGTLVHFLRESSQIFVQFGPTSLAKLPQEKRSGIWSKFSEEKENWSPMFSLGNLQISWGKWAQSSLTNMVCPKQQGNNVCPKELEPICSRKTCFLGGTWAHSLSRNLGSFVQGNHVSLGEIHNCS